MNVVLFIFYYRKGNTELLDLLLHFGKLDLNMVAHHKMSALHIASWHGHIYIVNKLIANGKGIEVLVSN